MPYHIIAILIASLEKSNWGTESQPDFAYNNGNKDDVGRGFGHTSVLVDDLKEACKRLESLGVKFYKKPTEGGIHTVAFIADPDDYWVEVCVIIAFN